MKNNINDAYIVSSDFHMKRVEFIFNKILSEFRLSFHEAPYLSICNKDEREKLIVHEKRALEDLVMKYSY